MYTVDATISFTNVKTSRHAFSFIFMWMFVLWVSRGTNLCRPCTFCLCYILKYGCRFAAVGPAGRRYRSIAARRTAARHAAGQCGQCHIVGVRRRLNTDSFTLRPFWDTKGASQSNYYYLLLLLLWLVAWHSGRTSVSGRRTFPVLRSTCSDGWPLMWVSHPLQVSQLGQLSLSSFRGR